MRPSTPGSKNPWRDGGLFGICNSADAIAFVDSVFVSIFGTALLLPLLRALGHFVANRARARALGGAGTSRIRSLASRRSAHRVDHRARGRARQSAAACRRDLPRPSLASIKSLGGDQRTQESSARIALRRILGRDVSAREAAGLDRCAAGKALA